MRFVCYVEAFPLRCTVLARLFKHVHTHRLNGRSPSSAALAEEVRILPSTDYAGFCSATRKAE